MAYSHPDAEPMRFHVLCNDISNCIDAKEGFFFCFAF